MINIVIAVFNLFKSPTKYVLKTVIIKLKM